LYEQFKLLICLSSTPDDIYVYLRDRDYSITIYTILAGGMILMENTKGTLLTNICLVCIKHK